ncbi:TPA: hypothetical protein LER00_001299 [Staphylococcus pseudintermedius]|nr:hypothetical protein [Staphylococcus pseudintermedius]
MILKYPENICMLCMPMVMHKNGGKSHENY